MVHEFPMIDWETSTTGDSQSIAVSRMVIQQSRLDRNVVHVWELYTVRQHVVDTGDVTILHQCVILHSRTSLSVKWNKTKLITRYIIPHQYKTVCRLLCAVDPHWTCSGGDWKLICLDSDENHLAHLCNSGTVYICHNVITSVNK